METMVHTDVIHIAASNTVIDFVTN